MSGDLRVRYFSFSFIFPFFFFSLAFLSLSARSSDITVDRIDDQARMPATRSNEGVLFLLAIGSRLDSKGTIVVLPMYVYILSRADVLLLYSTLSSRLCLFPFFFKISSAQQRVMHEKSHFVR